MTRDRSVMSSPLPETTAAEVSSHDVSMPRMFKGRRIRG
jgi:hypothetical protein